VTGIEAYCLLGICEGLLRVPEKYVACIGDCETAESAVGVQRDRPLSVGNGLVMLVMQRLRDPPKGRVGDRLGVIQRD
jgi:hypothetical protein